MDNHNNPEDFNQNISKTTSVFDNISKQVRRYESSSIVQSNKCSFKQRQDDFLPLSQLILPDEQMDVEVPGRLSPILEKSLPVNCVHENTVNKAEDDALFKVPASPVFQGFTTASNKKIGVSKRALRKVERLFNDIEPIDSKIAEESNLFDNTTFQGFTTASNKKIAVSEKSLSKAKELFNEEALKPDFSGALTENEELFKIPPSTSFRGFTTASNKKIAISEKSLSKAKELFDNEATIPDFLEDDKENKDLFKLPPSTSFQGFTTASNKKIVVSEKSLSKAKELFDEEAIKPDFSRDCKENEEIFKIPPSTSFQGFTTASNKKIVISEMSLHKVKKLFNDIDNDETSDSITAGNCTRSEDLMKIPPSTSFQGFTTASNKKIAIAEKSLSKAKDLFANIDSKMSEDDKESDVLMKIVTPTTFQGFSTASNKIIGVSEKSLLKAKTLFNDIENNEPLNSEVKLENRDLMEIPPSTSFQGFSTASNKKIAVSEKALNKVKGLFNDIEQKETTDEDLSTIPAPSSFQGFSTASNKIIAVSEKALSKAKSLFSEENSSGDNSSTFRGFSTASNKQIKISEEALKKTKGLFDNMDSEKDPSSTTDMKMAVEPAEVKLPNRNLQRVFDMQMSLTQEISESTSAFLADETFDSSIISSPTSPILTPKVTKRAKKFSVPFKKKKLIEEVEQPPKKIIKLSEELKIAVPSKNVSDLCESLRNKINLSFDTSDKKYNLKDLYDGLSKTKHCIKIPDEVYNLSLDNWAQFVFVKERQNLSNSKPGLSIDDLKDIFYNHEEIDKGLIPDGWIVNHLKWIVWKLVSYEKLFGDLCHRWLNAKNVLLQLKYRYDRELFKAERPILRKIIETDDIPGRRMILCVSDMGDFDLEVTDGWYSIRADLDACLCKAVKRGKIIIGTKLLIYGAELVNCGQGKSPLEDLGNTKLSLHGNSCRRAKPWSKLGLYSKHCGPPRFSLVKSHCLGGSLPFVTIMTINIYPSIFIEKLENDNTISRSEKLELRHCAEIEKKNQVKIEQIYNEVENEYSRHRTTSIADIMPESDRLMCLDTQDLAAALTGSQKDSIEQRHLDIKYEMEARVKKLMDDRGITKKRHVVEVMKVKGLVFEQNNLHVVLLSIWRPSEDIKQMLSENKLLNLYNVTPTGKRYDIINLSANKKTIILQVPDAKKSTFVGWEKYRRKCSLIREMQSPTFSPIGNEVDTIGIVFHIEPPLNDEASESKLSSSKVQTLYLSDENHFIVAVNFWGGIKKYGYENVIEIGCTLACTNLQHRSRTNRKRLRYLYATELSTFSQNPKKEHISDVYNHLKTHFARKEIDKMSFLEKCNSKLHSINSKQNASNLPNEEASLENLDFESTFIDSTKSINDSSNWSQDDSLFQSMNESNVEKRLKKLQVYGEPPPLPEIQLNISATLKKQFIAPVSTCDKIL